MKESYQTENLEKNSQSEDEISQFDIEHLFGKDTLEKIQEKIAKATGLAFVTVDYKGEPVTNQTFFTRHCLAVRNNKEALGCCKASDAFGGIQAAVTQKPSIYFCPCQLLEVAIPIIVKGHYLGGFIGGQIRCDDAPDEVIRLKNVMGQNLVIPKEIETEKLYEEVTKLSYQQFVNVAELVSLIINQLSEKEVSKKIQEETLKKEMEEIKKANQRLLLENKLKNTDLIAMLEQINPYFLMNTLTSISNLATIEDAQKTNEMLVMFAEYLKINFMNKQRFRNISEELENVERYLRMQKIKYGNRLTYSVQIPEKMGIQKIPARILLPFVENAIFYGIAMKEADGRVSIEGRMEEEEVVITVEDNGPGMSQKELEEHFAGFKGSYEGDSISIAIENAKACMMNLYGKQYDILTDIIPGKGQKVTIRYPKYFDERIEVDVSDFNS